MHHPKAVRWAVGSWSLFIAENLILSEHRTELIRQLGDENYHLLYGLCSTAACGTIAYSGYNIRKGILSAAAAATAHASVPKLSPLKQVMSFSFLGLGFMFISQSAPRLQIPFQRIQTVTVVPITTSEASPQGTTTTTTTQWKVKCPFDFHKPEQEIYGIDRVTRHSGLWSLGFLGAGLGMLSTSLPAQVWFSMPLMVALIGGEHTDSRYRRHMGGSITKQQEMSSNIPFLGILLGKQGDVGTVLGKLVLEEWKGINAGMALALAGAVVVRLRRAGGGMGGMTGMMIKHPTTTSSSSSSSSSRVMSSSLEHLSKGGSLK